MAKITVKMVAKAFVDNQQKDLRAHLSFCRADANRKIGMAI